MIQSLARLLSYLLAAVVAWLQTLFPAQGSSDDCSDYTIELVTDAVDADAEDGLFN